MKSKRENAKFFLKVVQLFKVKRLWVVCFEDFLVASHVLIPPVWLSKVLTQLKLIRKFIFPDVGIGIECGVMEAWLRHFTGKY